MPLVADYLPPAYVPPRVVDSRRFDFVSLDGTRTFPWGGLDCFVMAGIEGLDMAPRELMVSRTGAGSLRLDEIRDAAREIPFPVFVSGADHLQLIDVKADLRRYFDYRRVDYKGADGTFDLMASSATTQPRRLRVAYKDGGGGSYGTGDGSWMVLPLLLLAVDPDWHGEQWSTPTVRLPVPWPFLTPVGTRTGPLRITSSIALGADMPVTVTGELPSPATVEVVGPMTSAHITSPQGLDVTIGALTAGQTFRLETGRRKRALLNGVSAGHLLGSGPQWRPLPPGEASITIEVVGATSATSARVFGDSLWESPW